MQPSLTDSKVSATSHWLQTYYYTRTAVSVAWIALASTIGVSTPLIAAILLIAYPAWDAIANWLDANRSGGLRQNLTQRLNLVTSTIAALAVAIALQQDMYAVIGVLGIWACLSGLFQLATGVRRWKSYGAQWVMILSGAQSMLAAGHMIKRALGTQEPDITAVTLYAGFGAFYFLLSAIWLTVKNTRKPAKAHA